jgi:N-acetylglucosamine kinase-like BadF-type ATPase
MANSNAININSKSAVYGTGTAVYFGWGFSSNHMQIGGVGYTLSVDGSGFVKATAD